jgi:uncharacterized protein
MKTMGFLLLAFVFASCKTPVEFDSKFTRTFSIQSQSNGATYPIKVAVPENYSPQTQRYAVMYVLDGEELYDFVAQQSKEISGGLATSNVLVVSIGYGKDRTIDYTPTRAAEGGGGAEPFMLFIRNELIPTMEREYGADTTRSSRTILGHSFGGLCGAYAFADFNSVFGNYILLSPSLWYDNEVVLTLEQNARAVNKDTHQLVFLGLGTLENGGRMLAPFQAFYLQLKNNYHDIRIMRHLEPNLDHRGSEKPNITEGLNFYFQNR